MQYKENPTGSSSSNRNCVKSRSALNRNLNTDNGVNEEKNGFTISTVWRFLVVIRYVIFAAGIVFCTVETSNLSNKMKVLSRVVEERDALYEEYLLKEKELRKINEDFSLLNLKMNAIDPNLSREDLSFKKEASTDRMIFTDSVITRTDVQNERVEAMVKAIQERDIQVLEKKYGIGPYSVEVSVIIEGERRYFTIETAPNHLMPHSVRLFMDLVESKFWEDTMILHQLDHVAVIVPIDNLGVHKTVDISTSLIFSEYSEEYPHVKNTVGFQGVPGGPEFFINLVDNTDNHGPGEKGPNGTFHEGDACFGMITDGIDVALAFKDLSEKAEESVEGIYFSAIENMEIVSTK